jgi:hypothetical protein
LWPKVGTYARSIYSMKQFIFMNTFIDIVSFRRIALLPRLIDASRQGQTLPWDEIMKFLKTVAAATLSGILLSSVAFAEDKPVVGLVMKSLANEFFKT